MLPVMLWLLACTDDPAPPTPHDTARPEADEPACPDVCWWPDAAALPAPDVCNPWGLTPGVCPDGFTCEAYDPPPADPAAPRRRCVGGGGPYALVADLSPLAEPPRHVELLYKVAGLTWPSLHAVEDVEQLVLTGRRTGPQPPIEVRYGDVATELDLPPDTYDVHFAPPEGLDAAAWPQPPRDGVLEVMEDGAVTLDVDAYQVDLHLTLDGHRHSVVPEGSSLTLEWRSPETFIRASLDAGDPIPADVWLPAGTYEMATRLGGSGWPAVGTIRSRCVSAKGSGCAVSVVSGHLSGALTQYGRPIAGIGGNAMRYGDVQRSLDADGRFDMTILGVADTLTVDVTRGTATTLPDGAVPVAFGAQPAGGLTFDLSSRPVRPSVRFKSGTSTSDDVQAEDKVITLRRADGAYSTHVDDWSNDLTYAWQGDQAVSASWRIDQTRCTADLAEPMWSNETYSSFEAPLRRLALDGALRGARLFLDAPTNVGWRFEPVPGTASPEYAWLGDCSDYVRDTIEPLRHEVWLPQARWRAYLRWQDPEVASMAYDDELLVGEIDLTENLAWPYDLDPAELSVELRLDGAPAPLDGRGGVVSWDRVDIWVPADEEARGAAVQWPGEGDVTWVCEAPCAIEGLPDARRVTLWSGLEW